MRYRLLGRSGLRVSEIGLGTMTFGEEWGFGSGLDHCRATLATYVEAGGNFIDTADRYTNGTSERFVGDLISADRDWFVLGTKYALTRRSGDPNASGSHRKSLVVALDASLRRLQTDYVDIYWVHAWDPLTPLDEVLRALDDQVRAGKVLYLGISNAPAWLVAQANTLAEARGWTGFTAIQVEYSLIQRDVEREIVPMAEALGVGLTAWAPLGGGVLTGKYLNGSAGRLEPSDPRLDPRNRTIAEAVTSIAHDLGRPPAAVALSWLLSRTPAALPLVAARTAQQLGEALQASALELPVEARSRLDEVSHVDLGYPHDFLASEAVVDRLYGGIRSSISGRAG